MARILLRRRYKSQYLQYKCNSSESLVEQHADVSHCGARIGRPRQPYLPGKQLSRDNLIGQRPLFDEQPGVAMRERAPSS